MLLSTKIKTAARAEILKPDIRFSFMNNFVWFCFVLDVISLSPLNVYKPWFRDQSI